MVLLVINALGFHEQNSEDINALGINRYANFFVYYWCHKDQFKFGSIQGGCILDFVATLGYQKSRKYC